MTDASLVRPEDIAEYQRFCMHHLKSVGRKLPEEIWHYTTADGLIGILKNNTIFATQVSCLNDTREQRYFGDLIHDAVKERRKQNADPNIEILLRIADTMLADRDFSTAYHFVACFSDVEDDLGQWRGYGGGECGYAIGFSSAAILEALKRRNGALLMPLNYDTSTQKVLVDDVVRMAETYFKNAITQRGLADIEKWARDFLIAFATELDIFASITKHPKFSGEAERRIATALKPNEHLQLEFRQKRTLLARHLPLDITVTRDGKARLPLTRIYVGPGSSQRVTQVSVGDLRKKYGYGDDVKVELSKVPYRVP